MLVTPNFDASVSGSVYYDNWDKTQRAFCCRSTPMNIRTCIGSSILPSGEEQPFQVFCYSFKQIIYHIVLIETIICENQFTMPARSRPLGFRCQGDCGGLDYGSIVLASVKHKDKSRKENGKTTKRRTIFSKRNSGTDRTAASSSKTGTKSCRI